MNHPQSLSTHPGPEQNLEPKEFLDLSQEALEFAKEFKSTTEPGLELRDAFPSAICPAHSGAQTEEMEETGLVPLAEAALGSCWTQPSSDCWPSPKS